MLNACVGFKEANKGPDRRKLRKGSTSFNKTGGEEGMTSAFLEEAKMEQQVPLGTAGGQLKVLLSEVRLNLRERGEPPPAQEPRSAAA